jgi:hypothetical protein
MLVVGCKTPGPRTEPLVFAGGNGSSCEQAVVIREARFRELGMLAEKLWLQKNYPGYRQTSQSALDSASRHYDLVEVATSEGETRKVYFDTTEFIDK